MTGLQPDLFDRTNARHTDPASSELADREQKASGRKARNLDLVLELLAAHPEHTSRELAVVGGICRFEAARRLADLKRAGLATHSARPRPDNAGGRPGVSWFLTVTGRQAVKP